METKHPAPPRPPACFGVRGEPGESYSRSSRAMLVTARSYLRSVTAPAVNWNAGFGAVAPRTASSVMVPSALTRA